jgi:hypothetical protein
LIWGAYKLTNRTLNFRHSIGLLSSIILVIGKGNVCVQCVIHRRYVYGSRDIRSSYFVLCMGINIADFSGKELSDILDWPQWYLEETSCQSSIRIYFGISILMDEDFLLSWNHGCVWVQLYSIQSSVSFCDTLFQGWYSKKSSVCITLVLNSFIF